MTIFDKMMNAFTNTKINTVDMNDDIDIDMNKDTLVDLYYKRDIDMKLDPIKQINRSLKKLEYTNINVDEVLNKRMLYLFKGIDYVKYPDMSFNDYKQSYKSSPEYEKYLSSIYHNIERGMKLSKYIDTDKIKEFYMDCSLEELQYLGY